LYVTEKKKQEDKENYVIRKVVIDTLNVLLLRWLEWRKMRLAGWAVLMETWEKRISLKSSEEETT